MDWGYVAGYFDGEGTVAQIARTGRPGFHCSLVWHNSDLASLEAMREFMECGTIRTRKRREPHKQMYGLHIEKRSFLLRVIPEILAHSIIKADLLRTMLEWISTEMRDCAPSYGNLASAGKEEIRRLYWEDHLNLAEIGDRFGVSWTAVRGYMRRHDIPQRSRSEASRAAKRDSEAWAARSEKIRATRLANWQDSEYREHMVKTTQAAQPKRIAARQASRGTRDRW